MSHPNVEDTIIIEGIVTKVKPNGDILYKVPNVHGRLYSADNHAVREIIPAPWVPKVGDIVMVSTHQLPVRIIAIDDDVYWCKTTHVTSQPWHTTAVRSQLSKCVD